MTLQLSTSWSSARPRPAVSFATPPPAGRYGQSRNDRPRAGFGDLSYCQPERSWEVGRAKGMGRRVGERGEETVEGGGEEGGEVEPPYNWCQLYPRGACLGPAANSGCIDLAVRADVEHNRSGPGQVER